MEVSIIIPVFNCLDLTRACLESLEKTVPRRLRHEVLLIDDGSTDGSREWFATLPAPRYRVHLNDPPRQGYAANNNLGARFARGEVLCLLNNDTVLLPGWLTEMLKVLRADPHACCVGNIQREPASGLIDHRGVVFNRRGNPIHVGKDSPVPPESASERWPAVTAACCVVRRDLFLELGGFDETFRNGFEDVDFCLRAGERGLRHHVANRSIIYHHISASPGRHARHRENLRLYRRRWGWRVVAWRHRERFLTRKDWKAANPGPWTARKEGRRVRETGGEQAWLHGWEARREERRQFRQDLLDARADGWRYLKKHALRPWRYNFRRLGRALEQVLHPLPDPIPAPPPNLRFAPPASSANGRSGGVRRPEVPGGFLVFDPAEF